MDITYDWVWLSQVSDVHAQRVMGNDFIIPFHDFQHPYVDSTRYRKLKDASV
jgi:hypothetical protein